MNINELDSYNLADAVKFHRRLNPRIWGRDEHLLPEVRERLLAIAADFQEFLGVEDLNVKDITISGSNAAYSYTKNSDIDLHLVVDMPDNPVYQELFNAKKYQYNDEHNIRIGGADVELYVQPADQAHHSLGIYSVKNSDWISIPQRKRAQIDDACVRDKVSDLDARIHSAIKSKDLGRISTLWDKIKTMRQAGLEQQGEFGCENISFKLLRNSGCIAALKDAKTALQDLELSLREADRPQKKFRYGFSEDMMDPTQQPYSSANGVAPTTKSFLEDANNSNDVVQDFIQQVAMELGIDPMPEIHLHTNPEWSERNHSFGRYDPDSHTLNVSLPNRHVLDVLRTVAHELVHCSQNQQQGGLPDDAGETGSRWENDANARAGIIMRDWANSHPEHFAHDSLAESQIDHKRAADAIATALSTSVQEQQQPQPPGNDAQAQQPSTVLQMLGSAMKLYGLSKLTVPGAKEEFTQEFKNYIRAQGGDPNAQNLSRIYQMQQQPQPQNESASGYIPKNKREAAMPQYAMALSVDIKPGQVGKEANKLALKTGRNGEPGLLMPEAQNLLREFAEFTEEQDNLFEITMSPSSLKKLSAQTGALAGMEFEMIVPNIEGNDDGDQEPDYEYDQRCRSIEDAFDFFYDGDFNSRRDVERMRERMQNDYQEWLDDKIYQDWERRGEEYLEEWVPNNVDESEWNPEGLEGDERQEALEEFIANLHSDPGGSNAFDEYREENQESYDESDWLSDEDLDLMSAIENNYSMSWPHWTSVGSGEGSIEEVADSFRDAVGRPILASTSYHSGRVERPSTTNLQYIVEPDGSLNPDDSDDQGLEFVSPPLPIEELLSDLNKVKAWADRTGCYTNDSTGLHINVSVPGWIGGTDQLDYVKLALLLGDEFVLDSFGRAGNTYAKSAMGKIRSAVKQNPDRAKELMDRMKSGMDQLASKVVHSRSTEKYTSINVKDGYIEFRSPGGDWLNDNFAEIDNTLRRFTVALSAAVDPEAYRQEYLKKLYKLLDVSGEKDPLSYFAKFAAGELPRAALKSFVRQAQLERGTKRDKDKQQPQDDVTPFEIYNRDTGAVVSTVLARNAQEAITELEQFRAEQMQAQGITVAQATATYGIRNGSGQPAVPQQPQGVDTRVNYELYSRASGAVIDTFPARNDDEAITRLSDYINFGAGQSNPDNFDVRRAGRAPIAGSTLDLQRQRAASSAAAAQIPTIDIDVEPAPAPQPAGQGQWNGQWKVLVGGQEVYRFGGVGNSQADANRIAAAWLRSSGRGVSGEGFEVYPVMDESLNESIDADQVLQYVKKTHAPEEFNIEYSITDHPQWQLKNIPLSQLNLDPDGEQQDPYNRTNSVDYDVVRDLMPKIVQVLKSKPIVVDSDGWIIDGNHRAMAAVEAGLTNVPALVPVQQNMSEARKNPEQNTKYQSGWAELAAWARKNNVWLKPHEWAISMTYVPKLGINPGPGISEDTPRGIYFYPFHWAYSVKMDKEALPWADAAPYIQLFQYSTGAQLYDPNQIPLASAVAQLKNYGITDEDIAAEKENDPSISTYGLLVWCLGRKYDDNKRVSILNKVLRNLGYDSMIDNGKGWIAINEPTQGVVLNPKIIDKVITFNNYIRKKEQGVAENFADGKNPGRKGLAKRSGVNTKASVSSLRKTAKNSSGEKQRMAHWLANMKAGRAKAKRK
jgi:hypothetical protein